VAGKARRRVAAELIADLERIHARKEAADKVLRELGPRPAEACWICTASDPRVQPDCWVEVGDITRFPDRGHFASWSATAPIDASSGDHVRNPEPGRGYDRKKAAGKSAMEAMRCLKRRLSDLVYRQMLDDAVGTGPGGHRGNDSDSSATGSQPQHRLFGQAAAGPVNNRPKPALPKVC